ncbi:MAG: ABC transporter permease [Microbacteriaceae bacterium]|nr:MAG: ABC transporter permease [Microbacteriaceae bacterium]
MWQFLETTLQETTPIALAALAGTFAARSGIYHLGLEGLMCVGAFMSVAVTVSTGNVVLGTAAAIAVCLVLSSILWIVTVKFRANVIIAGLALTTLGIGGSTFAQQTLFATRGTIQSPAGLWRPFAGSEFPMPNVSILVLLLPVVVAVSWIFLRRSRFGRAVASVGEYPYAARSAGISVDRTRLLTLLIGGILCALAGTELALGGLDAFSSDMTAGRGFIAFSAVVLGASTPLGAAFASLFFGAADTLGIEAQLAKWPLPLEVVLMMPYILTIVAVALTGLVLRKSNAAQSAFGELRE